MRIPLACSALSGRAFLLMVTLLGHLAGCSSIGGLCGDAAECEGGNESDEDACVISLESVEDQADINECLDEFDEWVDCQETESTCEDSTFTAGDRCDEAQEALFSCIG